MVLIAHLELFHIGLEVTKKVVSHIVIKNDSVDVILHVNVVTKPYGINDSTWATADGANSKCLVSIIFLHSLDRHTYIRV